MVIRELTYQLHKLEASESALVSADHHDKKSVLGIGGKNPDRSIPNKMYLCLLTVYSVKHEFWTVGLHKRSWWTVYSFHWEAS